MAAFTTVRSGIAALAALPPWVFFCGGLYRRPLFDPLADSRPLLSSCFFCGPSRRKHAENPHPRWYLKLRHIREKINGSAHYGEIGNCRLSCTQCSNKLKLQCPKNLGRPLRGCGDLHNAAFLGMSGQ